MKSFLITGGAVLAGMYVLRQFILKDGPDDPTGFIQVDRSGWGLDDLAEAATITGMIFLAKKFIG